MSFKQLPGLPDHGFSLVGATQVGQYVTSPTVQPPRFGRPLAGPTTVGMASSGRYSGTSASTLEARPVPQGRTWPRAGGDDRDHVDDIGDDVAHRHDEQSYEGSHTVSLRGPGGAATRERLSRWGELPPAPEVPPPLGLPVGPSPLGRGGGGGRAALSVPQFRRGADTLSRSDPVAALIEK